MTMICLATYGDHAEIITDTASYLPNGAQLGRASKVLTIPHLDAAVITQGDCEMGDYAAVALWQAARQVTTFDDLVDWFPTWAPEEWRQCSGHARGADFLAFLIGYSPAAERFTAHGFASDWHDFEAFPIGSTWTMPTPFELRPSTLEARRFRAWERGAAEHHGRDSRGAEIVQTWMGRAPVARPRSVDEWVALAKRIRQERALESYANVFVAGDVIHTRIGRGETTTRKVHSFNDEGAEFLQMISATQHPVAQLMPCECGSGVVRLDCCLAEDVDKSCGCLSGKTFRDCCMVDRAAISQAS